MTQARRKALSALVILASPVAAVLTHLICRDNVPARIPSPHDWTGGAWWADDGIRTDGFFLAQLPSWVFLGIALVLLVRSTGDKRGAILGCTFGASMGFFFWIKTLLISYGAANIAAVHPQFWQHLLTVIVLIAYTRILAFVLPIPPRAAKAPPSSRISLAPGQRVVWFGQATSAWKLWGGVALVVASVPVAVASPSASIAVLLIAAFLWWGSMAKLRIDDRRVTVARGPLGWPRFSVPLTQVTAASAHQPRSLHSGRELGEGDPRSLLIRRGDAFVLETRDHLPIYVSVDHAEEAASVTNALIARTQLATPNMTEGPNSLRRTTGTAPRYVKGET